MSGSCENPITESWSVKRTKDKWAVGCGLWQIQNHALEGVTVTGRGGNGNMSPASQPALVSATSSGLSDSPGYILCPWLL